MRKLRLTGRDLLWIIGTPQCTRPCQDCRDHPARIEVYRRQNRDGSSYAITSKTILHLCDTCALRFVGGLVGMVEHMTHHRVDAELSMTTATRVKVDRDTGEAARHDRRVRARAKRLAA